MNPRFADKLYLLLIFGVHIYINLHWKHQGAPKIIPCFQQNIIDYLETPGSPCMPRLPQIQYLAMNVENKGTQKATVPTLIESGEHSSQTLELSPCAALPKFILELLSHTKPSFIRDFTLLTKVKLLLYAAVWKFVSFGKREFNESSIYPSTSFQFSLDGITTKSQSEQPLPQLG